MLKPLILFLVLCCASFAAEFEIPPSIRYVLDRENSSSQLVYYFTKPEVDNYPILVLCEGSSSKKSLGSVFFMHEYFLPRVEPLHSGFITVEKWGIDGNTINEEEFWNHYTCSQRLEDHLHVISAIEQNPPPGWNGQWIFIGVSEGGPLVTDLSIRCPNTVATVNWVGAGDWSWKEEFWNFFHHLKQKSIWMKLYDALPRWVPFSSDVPRTRLEYDQLVEEIKDRPSSDRWTGGMTWLYHADLFSKPPLDYSKIRTPFLVVSGSEDCNIVSSDLFVEKALEAGAPLTYLRVEGMDHWIRKRPEVIDQSFDWLRHYLPFRE